MNNILILGTGLIGKAIAFDLHNKFNVTCSDINPQVLKDISNKFEVKTIQCDFTNHSELSAILSPFDLVVSAVPGFMGYNVLKTVISAKKNVVDISFFPEDPFELDHLAKENNVTAIVDCGVAPGLCNLLAGYQNSQKPLTYYECLVGGLPVVRDLPYEYRVVFSLVDVLEEYTRPARLVQNGKVIIKEALSEVENKNFESIGTLESFNTDGLRTLIDTLKNVPDMKEKTLRYPGHVQLMKLLKDSGFLSKEAFTIQNSSIVPFDFTAKILAPLWEMKGTERDITVMLVTVKNEQETITYQLIDHFDTKTNTTSMGRTTGYTCTAVVNLIHEQLFDEKGIFPPELLGQKSGCFDYVIDYLKNRGIILRKETQSAISERNKHLIN